MRKAYLAWVLVTVGCGGMDVPREHPVAPGAAGAPTLAGDGGAGGSAPGGGTGAGTGIQITPSAGVGGGLSSAGADTGSAGGAPVLLTSGACVHERIAQREASAEGGEGGKAGDSGAAGARATDASAATPAGEGGAGLELGHGDLTLLVVFDKSGSMADPWDERTKWQVANEALMKAIDPVIDNLTLGTIFFPQPAGSCSVEPLESEQQIGFRTGRQFRAYWQETEESRMPDGSTPLESAMRAADVAIEQGCQLGLLNDRFRVVLVTDGEPTCGDYSASIVELVAEWNHAGVETWVMGLPGSTEAKTLLDAIALAGSTGQAELLGNPGELDNGLAAAAK